MVLFSHKIVGGCVVFPLFIHTLPILNIYFPMTSNDINQNFGLTTGVHYCICAWYFQAIYSILKHGKKGSMHFGGRKKWAIDIKWEMKSIFK